MSQPDRDQQPLSPASRLQRATQETVPAAENHPVAARGGDALAGVVCRLGDGSCAGAHASVISRAPAGRRARRADAVLQLQRQYGNRYVQRVLTIARQADGSGEVEPSVEASIQRARGGGQALDSGVRAQMEPVFGADFSGVRVHTGPEADGLNRALSARAFTTGQDIFFRQGEYSPGSSSGQALLAHELTHVVQQTGSVQTKLVVGAADDEYEREADQVAGQVMRMREGAPLAQRQCACAASSIGEDDDRVQRQLVTPLAPGGGFGGLLDRDRQALDRRIWTPPPGIRSVKVWLNAFIPRSVPGLSRPVPAGPYAGQTMLPGPIPGVSDCFLTDNRSFDSAIHAPSRMHSEVEINVSGPSIAFQWHHCDTTHEVDCEDGDVECAQNGSTSRMHFFDLRVVSPTQMQIRLSGAASNPCFRGAPDIDYTGTISIDLASRTVSFNGLIDQFPAYEMYATADGGAGATVFTTLPLPGKSPADLFGGADRPQSGSVTI